MNHLQIFNIGEPGGIRTGAVHHAGENSQEQLPDGKERQEKEILAELDRRTEIEKQAVRAIGRHEYEKAGELLKSLDNGILWGLMNGLTKLMKEDK